MTSQTSIHENDEEDNSSDPALENPPAVHPAPVTGPITRARARAMGEGLNKVMVMNQNHYWDKLRHVSHG